MFIVHVSRQVTYLKPSGSLKIGYLQTRADCELTLFLQLVQLWMNVAMVMSILTRQDKT